MLKPYPFQLFPNPRAGTPGTVILPESGFRRAKAEITSWPGYAPTPLRDLPELARAAGVAALRIKDEAGRFGLGSFKALGGAYAVAQLLAAELARRGVAANASSADLVSGRYGAATRQITVTCATDGNHGRSVAWGAQRFGCACVIFVHATVSQARVDAIARYGAEVQRVPGNYDDAVREAARVAAAQGWFVVSDTSWEGYTTVPVDVMQGYRVMADEAVQQWAGDAPTHVFVQGGVGGVAAAVSAHMRTHCTPAPELIVAEPEQAACLLASAELGEPTSVPGDLDTLMAGLACGEPSLLAWQELERGAAAFMAVPDAAAVDCMRLLAAQGMVAGESGVAGLAALLLAAADPAAREALGLAADSRVLLFSTEGATDPELYRQLVG
ncbi:diaminopropionate ammonia-lyase [Limobrevibacterium gyesilva]|uniref:Diaminopropionate ammonia-lyase n=1 Tax=Limobrevibacterium gyesilva TaxID=2991712 RepID=A0AA41YWG4_9PROT|nr:diaminopropionate ammonia-lyase [Limobrevibacterium gyesilva]MCW3477640.1 diaminopropionate ammonia-lyase [Limobrevibacterium gyesilva]